MTNTSASGGYLSPASPPPEDDAFVDIIQAAVVGITGLPGIMVRPRWQLDPPALPDVGTDWAAIGIAATDQDTFAFERFNSAGQVEVLARNESVDFLASFYGPNAGLNAATLRDGLAISQNREILAAQGIAFSSTDKILTVPELVQNQWLERKDITLTFRRLVKRTYQIESLQTAQVQASDGSLIATTIA